MSIQDTINYAVEWAVGIAKDDSHGYSQLNRFGNPDYDCSSLIIEAWEQAFKKSKISPTPKDMGASYTGNMRKAFKQCGFIEVPLKDRRKGDILLNEIHHTAMMINGVDVVHASISELGKTYGQPGDQTGREICVRGYYYHTNGWDCVLRYVGKENVPPVITKPTMVSAEVPLIKNGVNHPAVKSLQILLNVKAKESLDQDGECGPKTVEAIKRYQKAHNLTADGECGKLTWNTILNQ